MIPEWLRKLIGEKLMLWLKSFGHWVRAYWPFMIVAVMVWVCFVIIKSASDLKEIRIKQNEVKLWNKKIKTTAEDDSLIVQEMRELRENEVVIIYTYENEKVHIRRIPDDSLQFWADSLYNSTGSRRN